MDTIPAMLDRLSELRAAIDALRIEKQALIDQAVPAEVKQALADIDAECQPLIEAIETEAVELEGRIRDAVLTNGATAKGATLMAVYSKGRISWDSKQLEGMAALIPGLAAARREGEPSVTIRRV